jgi:hypothetical protein
MKKAGRHRLAFEIAPDLGTDHLAIPACQGAIKKIVDVRERGAGIQGYGNDLIFPWLGQMQQQATFKARGEGQRTATVGLNRLADLRLNCVRPSLECARGALLVRQTH